MGRLLLRDRWKEHEPMDLRNLLLGSAGCPSPFGITEEGLCDFRGVRVDSSFHESTIEGVDFSCGILGDGQFVGACHDCKFFEFECDGTIGREFLNCVFHNARLSNSVFYGKFINCDFFSANLSGVRGRHIRFERCNFENANLSKASFFDSDFIGCRLVNCTISSGSLVGTRFEDCEINGFDVSKAILTRVRGLKQL